MGDTIHSDYETLLRAARAGDERALGELLDLYRAYLSLLARLQIGRRLQGRLDPSDLVQETFLAAGNSFDQFRGLAEAELTAWLRQIMASKVADMVRRNTAGRRDVRLERQLEEDLDRSSHALGGLLAVRGSSPSQQAVRRENAVLLANALDVMPADYREVLILRHVEGLRFAEVAARMERTLDSVKGLWTRALVRLRRSMGEMP